jgi:hypothetical protein
MRQLELTVEANERERKREKGEEKQDENEAVYAIHCFDRLRIE